MFILFEEIFNAGWLNMRKVLVIVTIKSGSIIPLQQPGNTTESSRENPWSILVVLDKNGAADGSLYVDDGLSLVQSATKEVEFSYRNDTLSISVTGTYHSAPPLANVTIAGAKTLPSGISMGINGRSCETGTIELTYNTGVLFLTGLEELTQAGAWESNLSLQADVVGIVITTHSGAQNQRRGLPPIRDGPSFLD